MYNFDEQKHVKLLPHFNNNSFLTCVEVTLLKDKRIIILMHI